MAAYSYKGISKTGKEVKGVREAVSRQVLTSELLSEGIFVSSISDMREKQPFFVNTSIFCQIAGNICKKT